MKNRIIFLICFVADATICMSQTATTHTIQRGETLESIAKTYNISVEDLKKENPTLEKMYYVGMTLKIPFIEVAKQPSTQATNEAGITHNGLSDVILTQPTTQTDTQKDKQNGFLNVANYRFYLHPKSKSYGYHLGWNYNVLYFASDAHYSFEKHGSSSITFGAGVGGSYSISPILLQVNLYPYAGISMYDEPKYNTKNGKIEYKDKTDFAYGLLCHLGGGFKIYNKKDGGATFITFSYLTGAPEFETKYLFKSKEWTIGVTTTL